MFFNLKKLKDLSVRTHLIIGVTFVHAVLMCAFIFDQVYQEKELYNSEINETALSMAKTLAVSSSSWMISRDIAGLDELVQANKSYPNLLYAFITTPEGKVIAHTQTQYIGKYISDPKSLELMHNPSQITLIDVNDNMVDYAAPIIVHNKLLGWSRIALNREQTRDKINGVLINGIIYTLLAITMGGLMAWCIANLLTRQLEDLALVADSIRKGHHDLKADESSKNEIGRLASGFNQMMFSLNVSQQKLIQSAKMASLGEMAAGLAHEINNPLTIIIGRTERILNKPENLTLENAKIEFEKVNTTAKRIAKIIKALKSFSRADSNDQFEIINLNSIFNDSLSMCTELLQRKGIEISLNLEISPQTFILSKGVQISQVFINLINNSVDAIQNEKEKWIRIEAKKTDKNKIIIQFTDSGKGIPKYIADKIMQPFYTTKDIGEGTGLGLSISKGIIEGHGGLIYLNSESPHTCFVIELPIVS